MSAGIPQAPWQAVGAYITDAAGNHLATLSPTRESQAARRLLLSAPALLRFAEEQFVMMPNGADRSALGLLIVQAGGSVD